VSRSRNTLTCPHLHFIEVFMGKEYIAAIAAVIIWGTMATAAKLLTGAADSMLVLFWTCLTATGALTIYNAVKGRLGALLKLPFPVILRMTAIGSLGVFFYNWFFYLGCERLPAQQAMVINDLWPALIIIFSCFILKERMTLSMLAAVGLSFLGIIVVVTNGDLRSLGSADFLGITFCLADAVCYALYCVLGKRETYDKGLAVLVAYASAAVFALLILLIQGKFMLPEAAQWPGYLYNGIFCNALPYLLWVWALDHGNTAVIANLAYLAPFVSLLVTHFVLGEEITVWSVLGLVLIVSGILLQVRNSRKR